MFFSVHLLAISLSQGNPNAHEQQGLFYWSDPDRPFCVVSAYFIIGACSVDQSLVDQKGLKGLEFKGLNFKPFKPFSPLFE